MSAFGRVLRMALDTGESTLDVPEPEVLRRFVGGRGLAGHFLAPRAGLSWDDPAMPLLIFAGPLSATIAPSAGRACVMSRSPLAGTVADSSVGGSLGVQVRRAGLAGIEITGRARELSGLEVEDGRVRLVPASHLAGAGAQEVFQRLEGEGSLAVVGPAAETGCRFASIVVDRHHAAGRGGLGLVMAAKNLKYVRVKGSGRAKVRDKAELMAAREEIFRLAAASSVLMGEHGFSCYGTGALYDLIASRRMMPTDNFRATHFSDAAHLNAAAFKKRYAPRSKGCKGCHVLCKKVAADGTAMPEFETMSHFTALVGNRDLEAVVAANAVCNDLGMDTISAASTLACWEEIEGGTLGPGRILELLELMGRGLGLGRELAGGSARLAAGQGRPRASMSVKGLELPAYDPRGAYGLALGFAVANRGGCHLKSYPISHEILRKPVATDRFSFSAKARIVKLSEDAGAAVDSLPVCKFLFFAATLEEYARALAAVTGEAVSAQDLMRVGERVHYNERMMNAANGFTAEHDMLPERFFTEPGTGGGFFEVPPLDRDEFLAARARYYAVRGLDEQGLPTRAKALELGLDRPLKAGG